MKLKCRIKKICPGMPISDIILLILIVISGLVGISWMVINGN